VDRFNQILTAVEKAVVICAAVLAFFPLYEWYSERADRERLHLASITQMLNDCHRWLSDDGSINSQGGEDVYEHVCSRVLVEINKWEDAFYD